MGLHTYECILKLKGYEKKGTSAFMQEALNAVNNLFSFAKEVNTRNILVGNIAKMKDYTLHKSKNIYVRLESK